MIFSSYSFLQAPVGWVTPVLLILVPFFKAILTIYELISVYSFRYVYKYIFTRRRVMCSEGVARDWGTLVLPLAASKGQKVGGVPLGDLEERGTKSASVSHPNTKLQREWQWARITTACTSSASDQHCSPAFSSVWRAEAKTNTFRTRKWNKTKHPSIFF